MIDPNKPVRVFKNWKLGCYNIMQSGKLLASAKQVRLSGVEFLVRSSGRQRMLERGRRNVHAYAVGRLVDYVHPEDPRTLDKIDGRSVSYNPYRYAWFVDNETQNPVTDAKMVQFEESGVVYV
ncbi:MAG: hypothetical protein QNI91_11510 [Arenicellales bacterium]|nr:hypothetical protein [Arenicellales bacterium]